MISSTSTTHEIDLLDSTVDSERWMVRGRRERGMTPVLSRTTLCCAVLLEPHARVGHQVWEGLRYALGIFMLVHLRECESVRGAKVHCDN